MKIALIYGLLAAISGIMIGAYITTAERYKIDNSGNFELLPLFVLFTLSLFIAGFLSWKIAIMNDGGYLNAFFVGMATGIAGHIICWFIFALIAEGFKLSHILSAFGFTFFSLIMGGWFAVLWSIAMAMLMKRFFT